MNGRRGIEQAKLNNLGNEPNPGPPSTTSLDNDALSCCLLYRQRRA